MRLTGNDGAAGASELSNLRFLVAEQLRAIDDLDRRGLDGRDARALLSRLMRRHEEIRCRPAGTAQAGLIAPV